jgi:heme exporter protein CcmD
VFGPHAAFIVPAYVATAIAIGALAAWIAFSGRRLAREIAALEQAGVTRRSGGGHGRQ